MNEDLKALNFLKNKWFIYLIVLSSLFLVIILGGIYYRRLFLEQNRRASTLFSQLTQRVNGGDYESTKLYADKIVEDYPKTTYACFSKLILAKRAVDDQDFKEAEEHLRWNYRRCRVRELKNLSRLRLIRVLLGEGKLSVAQQYMLTGNGKMRGEDHEILGDYLVMQGKKDEAKQAYQRARDEYSRIDRFPFSLQLKLRQF